MEINTDTTNTVKRLWSYVPTLTFAEIAKRCEIDPVELENQLIILGISHNEIEHRKRFVSYCLEGRHMKRCKFCGIVLYDRHNGFQKNYGGFCQECLLKFQPRKYFRGISWYRNMMLENWLPTNTGWRNEVTGVFLPKKYISFFQENFITP